MTTVCVTGAAGFIGSHIVKLLLEKGYNVRGTVRDPTKREKTEHLLRLPNASTNLTLFAADLVKEGSFDEAVTGCQCVFHTASPILNLSPAEAATVDGQKEFVDPAVGGTRNVFGSISRVGKGTVKKVVLTSSMASVGFNGGRLPSDYVYTEEDWSIVEVMQERKLWYPLSKTLAEREAWSIHSRANSPEADPEGKFSLAVINPTFVFGPLLQPEINASSNLLLNYVNGSKTEIPNSTTGIVDVRDVALAHVLAFEGLPEAQGRYILMQGSYPMELVCELLRKLYPDLPIPTKIAEGSPPIPMKVSNARAQSLGIPFGRSIEDILADTVTSFKDNGLL